MKFYTNPQDAYLAHQSAIRQLLGAHDVEYTALSPEQRIAVNNRLLSLTKYVHDTAAKPSFLLFDFGILHDANLLCQTNPNEQLQAALNGYVANQINYFAGYAASQSTPYDAFLEWAETDAYDVGCPVSKTICTSYYATCTDAFSKQELNTSLILQNALNAQDVLRYGVGINNGLRLAALYDSGSVQESSRVILDKACDDILRDIPGHREFASQLSNTDLAETFSAEQSPERGAAQWEEEQSTRITGLLKQAKREAIRQSRLTQEQARIEAVQREDNRTHEVYVATVKNANDIVGRQNAAVTKANAANAEVNKYNNAARYYQRLSDINSAASQSINQAMLGAAAPQHSLSFSMSASRQNGLTFSSSHSIHQGGRLVASASSRYNSVESYNQRVSVAVARAQAMQAAMPLSPRISEPLAHLREFVAQNSQHLQGFDVPELPVHNPYALRRDEFLQDFEPGVTQASNYGQQVVEQTYSLDRATTMQNFAFTPDSKFNAESDNSALNISLRQLQQSNWQPVMSAPPVQSPPNSLLNKLAGATLYGVATILTGRTAEAMPLPTLSSGLFSQGATAPGVISANRAQTAPPVSLKGLGAELADIGNKALLLASIMTNPLLARHVYGILTTPIHQMDNEDTMGGNEAHVDSSLPPYNQHALDQDGHMLPGSTGRVDVPNEMINVPPRTDGFLTMYMSDKNSKILHISPDELTRSHAIQGKNSGKKVEQLAASFRENGFSPEHPIEVVQHNGKNYVVDGHHRLKAAKQVGLSELPIRVITDIKNHASGWESVEDIVKDAESCDLDNISLRY